MRSIVQIPLALVGLAIVLFPVVSAIYGLIKWRGGWRMAAVVPIIVLFVFFAPMVPDWIRDPTAHNLWGLVFLPLIVLLSAYSGVVALLHRKGA